MATRAERFKSDEERSGPKKAPSKKTRDPKKAVEEGVSKEGTRRIEGSEHTAERNVKKSAGAKAQVKLEDSTSGTPSRKSTRASKNHGKPASSLQRKVTSKATSPASRATKAKAKATKTR